MTKRPAAKPKHEDLAEAVTAGDRRALARAITLIESTRADHRAEATALLGRLLPAAGKSVRLGDSLSFGWLSLCFSNPHLGFLFYSAGRAKPVT